MKTHRLAVPLAVFTALSAFAQTPDNLVTQGRAYLGSHDLTNANLKFAAALALAPNHQTANAFYAATRLLVLPSQTPINGFLNRLGVSSTNRNIYAWATSAPSDTNGIPYAPAGINTREALLILRTNILPQVTAAAANLAKVVDTNFTLTLFSGETTLADVTLDYGDCVMLRAMLHGAEYAGYMLNAQNLDAQLSALRVLYDADHLTIERVLRDYPQLLAFATTNDLLAAREAFSRAVDDYQAASTFILNRPSGLIRLFNLDPGSDGDQANFRQNLLDLKASLNGPVVLTSDYQYTVHAARHFQNPQPWRSLLPQFLGDSVILGSLPDLTFGGQFIGTTLDDVEEGFGMVLSCTPVVTHIEHLWGQAFQFYSRVVPDHGYVVQVSSNLVAWQDLGAFIALDWTAGFSDPAGPATSQRFYRLVDRTGKLPPPANDNFANRVVLTGYGNAAVGYNESASREPSEPAWDSYAVGRTVWYSWLAPVSGQVAVSVQASSSSYFSPRIGVFTGSTLASLVQVATGSRQLVFNAVAGTAYQIAVDGYAWGRGPTGGFRLVIARPPVLTLSSPTNGAAFAAPANVLISGAVTPGDGSSVAIGIRGSGTTNLVLSLPGPTFAYWWTNLPSGNYSVSVNVVDSLGVSASTNVNFRAPPTNDNFTNRIPIAGSLPQVITGSNRGAGVESGEPTHAGYSPYNSVWWSWTAPQSGSITIECWGTQTYNYGTSPFSTALAVYTGNALTNLSVVASNYPSFWGFPSLVRFPVVAGSIYQIALDGSGYQGDLRLLLTTNAPPTVTLTSPINGARFVGPTNLLLTATASGSAPITRVDFYNSSSLIASVTNGPYSLVWSNVANSSYAYQITARATDSAGLVGYATASVRVDVTPPLNDDFANALPMTGTNVTTAGTTAGATYETGEPYHYWYRNHSVWWYWTAPANGRVTLSTTGVTYSYPVLGVYTGSSVSSLSPVSSGRYTASGNYDTCTNSFDALAGTVYRIAVDGGSSSSGPISLSLNFVASVPPPNDNFVNALPMTGTNVTTAGTTAGATYETGEPYHSGYRNHSVWWSWTAPANGRVALSTTGVAYSYPVLGVYTGSSISNLSQVSSGSYTVGGNYDTCTNSFDALTGTTYRIAVDGGSSSSGPISLNLNFVATVPPSNDNFVNRIPIAGSLPQVISGSNRGASAESGEPAHAGYSASRSLWWSWTAPQSGSATLECWGTQAYSTWAISTRLAVYTGNAVTSLTPVANNYPNVWGFPSLLQFGVTAGSVYQIAVDADYDSDLRFLLTTNAPPTVTLTSPTNGARFIGPTNLVLTATASGNASIARVDFYNGNSLIGSASNSPYSLVWNNVANAEYYLVAAQATDSLGLVGYSTVNVTVAPPPPPNDNFSNRALVSGGSFAVNGSTYGATGEPGEPYHAGNYPSHSVWWSWTASSTGQARLQLAGTNNYSYPRLAVYTGTNSTSLTAIASANCAGTWPYNSVTLPFNSVAGTVYQIAADSSYWAGFSLQMTFLGQPPSVAITSPLDGQRVVAPPGATTNVMINLSASDPDGPVTNLSVYGDGQLLGQTAGSSLSLVWSNVGWGSHSISATATDNMGAQAQTQNSFSVGGPEYTVRTFAGPVEPSGAVDAIGSAGRFNNPNSVAADAAGNVYVADTDNHTIRKITPSGAVTTLAGLAGYPGYADGKGGAARFSYPQSVAVDAAGNVYVAESYSIRKITPDGAVSTLAGGGNNWGSADGVGSTARFNRLSGVASDAAGNLYVADMWNHTIRKITSAGVVSTLAGLAGNSGSSDGITNAARFYAPSGVAVDTANNVYVADRYNSTIRTITPDGVVTTLAGFAGYRGITDATGSTARFDYPQGVAVDAGGNVYVADSSNKTIRKITPGGAVSTLAGLAGYGGGTDATGSTARFYYPRGLAVGTTTNIFVADSGTIRRITPGGVVSTLAGMGGAIGKADGLGNTARFDAPSGVAADGGGIVYVADSNNRIIRKISSAGLATTLAGSGNWGSADGPSNTATFSCPRSVAVDGSTNVYVADSQNQTIRKITSAGIVSTLAGLAGSSGTNDGAAGAARFYSPGGVAANAAGTVYVADAGNHTIRMITPSGVVSTLAGLAGVSGSADGPGSAARFYYPNGVAVDAAGNVYVADSSNYTIRKITPGGVVSTLAGLAGYAGNTDNTGSAARFNLPNGVAVDAAGNVYVADTRNPNIRKITPDGAVSTLAGLAGNSGAADGTEGAARFNQPDGVAVDASGNVYVSDFGNHSIRFITTNTLSDMPVITPAQAAVGVVRQLDTLLQTGTGWAWSLIRRPSGSVAALSSTSIRNPTFTPDVKDSFVFRLVATNNTGGICIRTLELKPENIQ